MKNVVLYYIIQQTDHSVKTLDYLKRKVGAVRRGWPTPCIGRRLQDVLAPRDPAYWSGFSRSRSWKGGGEGEAAGLAFFLKGGF